MTQIITTSRIETRLLAFFRASLSILILSRRDFRFVCVLDTTLIPAEYKWLFGFISIYAKCIL